MNGKLKSTPFLLIDSDSAELIAINWIDLVFIHLCISSLESRPFYLGKFTRFWEIGFNSGFRSFQITKMRNSDHNFIQNKNGWTKSHRMFHIHKKEIRLRFITSLKRKQNKGWTLIYLEVCHKEFSQINVHLLKTNHGL